MKRVEVDQYLHPKGSFLHRDLYVKQVPWKFGQQQKIQAKKIIASTGAFKNLTGANTNGGTVTNGMINTSLFQQGTVANSIITGATISNPSVTLGTFIDPLLNAATLNNPVIGTQNSTGGTWNNGVLGTPQIMGGTLNPSVYQASGTVGLTSVTTFIRTGTIVGTLTFQNGLLIGTS